MNNRVMSWLRYASSISYRRDLPLIVGAFRFRHNWLPPDDIWRMVDGVPGFLSPKEAGFLYRVAQEGADPVVELGSYEGRSTAVLALAGRRVHAVDAWSPDTSGHSSSRHGETQKDALFGRFKSNMKRLNVEGSIVIHRGFTHDVGQTWTEKAAVMFIDAGHTYEDVRDDLTVWAPHVRPDGILLMHDVLGDAYPGVTRAASELLHEGWRVVASGGSIVGFART